MKNREQILSELINAKKKHLSKRVNLSFKEDGVRILEAMEKAHLMFESFPYYYTSTMYYEMGDYVLPQLKQKLKDVVNEF